jgi:ADP-ribose pyrophosphatase YjhB (NUDIX family)
METVQIASFGKRTTRPGLGCWSVPGSQGVPVADRSTPNAAPRRFYRHVRSEGDLRFRRAASRAETKGGSPMVSKVGGG